MKSTIMNDYKYTPKPLKLITPNHDYKVDEKELADSMKKNKKLIASIQRIRAEKDL